LKLKLAASAVEVERQVIINVIRIKTIMFVPLVNIAFMRHFAEDEMLPLIDAILLLNWNEHYTAAFSFYIMSK